MQFYMQGKRISRLLLSFLLPFPIPVLSQKEGTMEKNKNMNPPELKLFHFQVSLKMNAKCHKDSFYTK